MTQNVQRRVGLSLISLGWCESVQRSWKIAREAAGSIKPLIDSLLNPMSLKSLKSESENGKKSWKIAREAAGSIKSLIDS